MVGHSLTRKFHEVPLFSRIAAGGRHTNLHWCGPYFGFGATFSLTLRVATLSSKVGPSHSFDNVPLTTAEPRRIDLTGCALEIRLQRRRTGSSGLSRKGRGLRGSCNLYRRASALPGNLRHGERGRRAGAREQTATQQKFGANRGSQGHNAQAAGIAWMEVDADNADRQRLQGSPSREGIARRQNHRSGFTSGFGGHRRGHLRYARSEPKWHSVCIRLLFQTQKMDQHFRVKARTEV